MPESSTEIATVEKHLPLPQEIRARIPGWPTAEDEKDLKEAFMNEVKPQIQPLVSHHHPDYPPLTEDKLSEFSHLLYGIYLFNYITAGKLIHEDLYPEKISAHHQKLNPNLLRNWPLNIPAFGSGYSVDKQSGLINLPLNLLSGLPLDVIPRYIDPERFHPDAFNATNAELKTLIGLEEAHHAFTILYGYRLPDPQLPIEFNKRNSLVDYDSSSGIEFQATSMIAQAVQRYFPQLWQLRGYKDFWQKVSAQHKSFFHGQK